MDAVFGKAVISGAVVFPRAQAGLPDKGDTGMQPAKASTRSNQGMQAKGVQEASSRTSTVTSSSEAIKACSNSTTTAPLPLPASRPLFPGPLKFLWFAKQSDPQAIELEASTSSESGLGVDPKVEEQDTVEIGESVNAELHTDSAQVDFNTADDTLENATEKSWVYNIWGLRSMLPEKPSATEAATEDPFVCDECNNRRTEEGPSEGEETRVALAHSTEAADVSSEPDGPVCLECEMDVTEEPSTSMLEVPHVQVAHSRESFSKFLHPLSVAELKGIARMSHLCNLAYVIREIKPSELLMRHHLRLITSSLDKKAEALAKEKAATTTKGKASGNEGTEVKQRFSINPASAYALASAVASYLHYHTKSLLHLKSQNENSNKELIEVCSIPDSASQNGADSADCGSSVEETRNSSVEQAGANSRPDSTDFNGSSVQLEASNSEQDFQSSEMASIIASSPVTAVVAAKEGTKDAVAKDLQSLHSCPCEWYCCDDRRNHTRYFIIQGSESLASWQANLLFEPTHFEDTSLGVLVHRGIYEAAKGLYEQLLPSILKHLQDHGEEARFCFAGHSLGGSLATLVSLMLQIRGVVPGNGLLPVLTFGSPCIMCGGDFLLEKLGLPRNHVRSVILHRDIVPRVFACNYPDHVAEVLKRLNGSFRDHPCLNHQRLLYAPMGEFLILQPSEEDAPPHPFLPSGLGLHVMKHPQHNEASLELKSSQEIEVRAAQRAFLNSPHPLEILSDPGSYGSEGSISRDHDPRSYMKSINKVVREESKKRRRLKREQRRSLWWPLMKAELSSILAESEQVDSISSEALEAVDDTRLITGEVFFSRKRSLPKRFNSLVAFHHIQMVLLFVLSAKVMLMQGFAAFFAWV